MTEMVKRSLPFSSWDVVSKLLQKREGGAGERMPLFPRWDTGLLSLSHPGCALLYLLCWQCDCTHISTRR